MGSRWEDDAKVTGAGAFVATALTVALIFGLSGTDIGRPTAPEPVAVTAPSPTTVVPPPPATSTTTATTPPPVAVTSAPSTAAPVVVDGDGWTWDELADCESGEWNAQRQPIPGTARWDDHRSGYEGGLHFAPPTWDANKPDGYPDGAHQATREQQIVVGEIVLDRQGPGAWPVCSRKAGMR